MRAGGWVWDVPRSSHVYHLIFPHSLLSHWNIHTIAIMCRLYILCPCSHSAIWHALYTFPTLHSLPARWTQQTLESQEKWKHSLLVKGHGLVLLQYALAKKKKTELKTSKTTNISNSQNGSKVQMSCFLTWLFMGSLTVWDGRLRRESWHTRARETTGMTSPCPTFRQMGKLRPRQ